MKKSVVLFSGGLDSTVSLKKALDQTKVVLALTFNYGQKAAPAEIEATSEITSKFDIPHLIIDLPWYQNALDCALVDQDIDLPRIDSFSPAMIVRSAQKVWAYNRNGLFINIAAVYAEKYQCRYIITGFNKEEAQTFPDNSEDFCSAITNSLGFSTQNHPRVLSYTQNMAKPEIVAEGLRVEAPLDLIWSCYQSQTVMCGVCESCQMLKKALAANNILEKAGDRFANTDLIG